MSDRGRGAEQAELADTRPDQRSESLNWLQSKFSNARQEIVKQYETREEEYNECPARTKAMIKEKLDEDERQGITDKEVLEERKYAYLHELKSSVCVERGGKLYTNKESIKNRIRKTVEEVLLNGDNTPEALSHFVRISIDVNGLKAINDFASHGKGDIFLQNVAIQLRSLETKIRDEFKCNDVELSLEGGDEFGFYIDMGRKISEAEGENIQMRIHEGIAQIESDNLITREDILDKNPKAEVPLDYTFKVTAGVGVLRFDNALLDPIGYENIRKEIDAKTAKYMEQTEDENWKPSQKDYIDIMMGEIMDRSEDVMKEDKALVKERLKEKDPTTWELLEIRDQKTRELTQQNETLARDLQTCKESFATLKTLALGRD